MISNLMTVMADVRDRVLAAVGGHERDCHGGSACWSTRVGTVAFLCHCLGFRNDPQTFTDLIFAASDYDAGCDDPACHVPVQPGTRRPTRVCLVGSSRFQAEHEAAIRAETLAGRIVLPLGLYGHQEGMDMDGPVKRMLDELHLRKVDAADQVFVVNPLQGVCPDCKAVWRHDHLRILKCSCGCDISAVEPVGYVGESTRREVAYARAHGKLIRSLNTLVD